MRKEETIYALIYQSVILDVGHCLALDLKLCAIVNAKLVWLHCQFYLINRTEPFHQTELSLKAAADYSQNPTTI